MQEIQQTRDIAVEAITKIDGHMMDCTEFRKGLLDSHKEFRSDLKKLEFRMAMLLGALIVVSHGIDWLVNLVGHH